MLPSYLKSTYSNLFPSTVFPCQCTSCSNLSFQSVFLLSFLQPAVWFHTAKVVVQKCKSDHVTTLLNFLQGPPMSLRMKSVPWPTWFYLVCTYVFLWPHLPSVFDSIPLYRLSVPWTCPCVLTAFPRENISLWRLSSSSLKPQLKYHRLRDVSPDHLMYTSSLIAVMLDSFRPSCTGHPWKSCLLSVSTRPQVSEELGLVCFAHH